MDESASPKVLRIVAWSVLLIAIVAVVVTVATKGEVGYQSFVLPDPAGKFVISAIGMGIYLWISFRKQAKNIEKERMQQAQDQAQDKAQRDERNT